MPTGEVGNVITNVLANLTWGRVGNAPAVANVPARLAKIPAGLAMDAEGSATLENLNRVPSIVASVSDWRSRIGSVLDFGTETTCTQRAGLTLLSIQAFNVGRTNMPLEISSYLKAYERDQNLRNFCEDWLLGARTGGVDGTYDARIARLADTDPDLALQCAVSLVELASGDVEDLALSGPLELILVKRGSEYIDVVCELSRLVPRLRNVLACIWGQHIPKPVMRKIELFRAV